MKKKIIKKRDIEKKKNIVHVGFYLGFNYLKETKYFILFSLSIFFISALIGYFDIIGYFSPELSLQIQKQIISSVEEIVKQTQGLGIIGLIKFIMSNNIRTSFYSVVSGIFFGIIPAFVILFNGYVLGFVSNVAVNNQGILSLWKLFPHGIFEIPAILISVGLGIKLGIYPFFLKEKGKGVLSLLLSFVIFAFLAMISAFFISIIYDPSILINPTPSSAKSMDGFLNDPVLSIIFLLLISLSLIASIIIGEQVLSKKDKAILNNIFKNTILTFLFIVIPLLVIAGIIEGLLIGIMG